MTVRLRRAWHPLGDLTALELGAQGLSPADRTGTGAGSRFPLRALRYWFMYRMIHEESAIRKRPLEVLEAGPGAGAMLAFLKAAKAGRDGPITGCDVGRWDGLDVTIDRLALAGPLSVPDRASAQGVRE